LPDHATHWSTRAMAKIADVSATTVRRITERHANFLCVVKSEQLWIVALYVFHNLHYPSQYHCPIYEQYVRPAELIDVTDNSSDCEIENFWF
jgi:hypothetical protein